MFEKLPQIIDLVVKTVSKLKPVFVKISLEIFSNAETLADANCACENATKDEIRSDECRLTIQLHELMRDDERGDENAKMANSGDDVITT